jgi:hypothetical protein
MPDTFDSEAMDDQPTDEELDEWARATEQVMSKCAYSQPYEDGEPVWLNDHGPLRDALDIAGVSEEYFEEVVDRIRCPCCGNSYELFEDVGLKAEAEMRFEELHAQWLMDHQHRLDEFYTHLENYPYMGLSHAMGREINDSMKLLPRRILTDCVWYRARRINSGRTLSPDAFRLPDPEKVTIPEGRLNHHGKPVVYMAETAEAAVTEVLEEGESRAWVMKVVCRMWGRVLIFPSTKNGPKKSCPYSPWVWDISGIYRAQSDARRAGSRSTFCQGSSPTRLGSMDLSA